MKLPRLPMSSDVNPGTNSMIMTDWIKTTGIVLIALGILSFPVGFGASPKRNTSAFSTFADLGLFWKVGLILIASGLLALIVSAIISSLKKVKTKQRQ